MSEENALTLYENPSGGVELFQEASSQMNQLFNDLHLKDHYSIVHSGCVFNMAMRMGVALGYNPTRLQGLLEAAMHHDLGKVFIPDAILKKPSSLSTEEFNIMKSHVFLCREPILEACIPAVYEIILQHHERMNGSGYPNGLAGDEILEEARIIAICDSYDAMTTDRIYQNKKSHQEACRELFVFSGILYDDNLVKLFIDLQSQSC